MFLKLIYIYIYKVLAIDKYEWDVLIGKRPTLFGIDKTFSIKILRMRKNVYNNHFVFTGQNKNDSCNNTTVNKESRIRRVAPLRTKIKQLIIMGMNQ